MRLRVAATVNSWNGTERFTLGEKKTLRSPTSECFEIEREREKDYSADHLFASLISEKHPPRSVNDNRLRNDNNLDALLSFGAAPFLCFRGKFNQSTSRSRRGRSVTPAPVRFLELIEVRSPQTEQKQRETIPKVHGRLAATISLFRGSCVTSRFTIEDGTLICQHVAV